VKEYTIRRAKRVDLRVLPVIFRLKKPSDIRLYPGRRQALGGADHAIHSLSAQLLSRIDAYWRAANYLSLGQIYLYDNPLLREPLKPTLLGHCGTTPGQNFIYAHLNRVIKQQDLDMIYVCGPRHGGPAVVANTYLEGTYSEIYSHVSQDEAGLQRLFRQFSFSGAFRAMPRLSARGPSIGGARWRRILPPQLADDRVEIPQGVDRGPSPGLQGRGDTHVVGRFLRDVVKLNAAPRNFRIFGPDETLSNGLEAVFDATRRQWEAETLPTDQYGLDVPEIRNWRWPESTL